MVPTRAVPGLFALTLNFYYVRRKKNVSVAAGCLVFFLLLFFLKMEKEKYWDTFQGIEKCQNMKVRRSKCLCILVCIDLHFQLEIITMMIYIV